MHDHQLGIDRPLGVAGGVADRRSPGRGFVERALRIGQHRGKLARDQVGLPDPLQKGRDALQFGAVLLMWVKDADRQVQFLPHNSHRLGEI